MKVFILFFMLVFSSALYAQGCECPAVQCDPCQKPVLLGTEELSCNAGTKTSCNKFVCENVDNFFQCLAGAKPVHASQDIAGRLTEPQDPAEKKPEAIDFRKFADSLDINLEDEEEVKKPAAPVQKEVVRSIASLFPKLPAVTFQVTSVTGKVEINRKRLRNKPLSVAASFAVKALEKGEIVVKGAQSHFTVKMAKGSEWSTTMDEDVLWFHLQKGDMVVSLRKTDLVHAVDTGLWRLAKREGVYGVSRHQDVYTLLNEEGFGYLRRNELISSVEEVSPKKLIQLSSEDGILAYKDTNQTPVPKRKFEMPKNLQSKQRNIASQELCGFPAGVFESCAWKCFGSGAKDKKCGQAKNSQCVRFTCSADGLWKLPTTATSSECVTETVRVGACQ